MKKHTLRDLMRATAGVALAILTQGVILAQSSAAQPNVVIIVCDDLNDTIEGMGGHQQAKTPNIDRLMDKGVRFTNAHCNAPICGPSRASFWTGLYPSTTGFYGYNQQANRWRDFPILSDAVTIMEHYKNNGYNVWGSGKVFHNGHDDNSVFTISPDNDPDNPGPSSFGPFPWDGVSVHAWGARKGVGHPSMPSGLGGYWEGFGSLDDVPTVNGWTGWSNETGDFRYVNANDRDLMADEISANWVATKLGQNHTKPFLLTVGLNRPHNPMYAPKEFFDLFPIETIELPPYLENDLDDVPAILRPYSAGISTYRNAGPGNDLWWKKFVQAYLACVAYADHQVGKIVDSIENSDYSDNTIIIFTSDHGLHLGEKDHDTKTTTWEETTRVPLVVVAPGVSQANRSCGRPVSLVDLYPTLIALCQLPPEPNSGINNRVLDGHDLSPLLANPSTGVWEGPKAALSHLHANIDVPANTKSPWSLNHHSVRSQNQHYVLCNNGEEELYDHLSDPNEWSNEAGNASYAQIKGDLKNEMCKALGFVGSTQSIADGGFENDTNNWDARGPSTIQKSGAQSFEKENAALVSNRTEAWHGIGQQLQSVLEAGKTYHFSAWVRLSNTSSDQLSMVMRQVVGTVTGFSPISSVSATDTQFSLLQGDYTVPESGDISALTLMVSGAQPGVDFYLDHVSCLEYEEPTISVSIQHDPVNEEVLIRWNAELGVSYRIEESTDLAGAWAVRESDLVADRSSMNWSTATDPVEGRGFWRITRNE